MTDRYSMTPAQFLKNANELSRKYTQDIDTWRFRVNFWKCVSLVLFVIAIATLLSGCGAAASDVASQSADEFWEPRSVPPEPTYLLDPWMAEDTCVTTLCHVETDGNTTCLEVEMPKSMAVEGAKYSGPWNDNATTWIDQVRVCGAAQ